MRQRSLASMPTDLSDSDTELNDFILRSNDPKVTVTLNKAQFLEDSEDSSSVTGGLLTPPNISQVSSRIHSDNGN